ncbi:MAG: hypothetical protein Q7R89_03795 [bacterium]|nr:hypothetical protein [bacterium]
MINLEDPNNQEPNRNLLLEKINKTLLEMGSKAKYLKLPEDFEEYKSLKGKKILMLDDVRRLLEAFIPDLMVATDGNATYVLHEGKRPDETAKEIIEKKPDVALLDYDLSNGVTGIDIYNILKENGYSGQSIGFSSSKTYSNNFKKAGIENCVNKDTGYIEGTLKELAKLVTEKNL